MGWFSASAYTYWVSRVFGTIKSEILDFIRFYLTVMALSQIVGGFLPFWALAILIRSIFDKDKLKPSI